jgi:radical SAM protein with 4Fe4S-binding SPASM domain
VSELSEEEQFSFHQRLYLDQPKEVNLETFSKCNAACTFCPYTQLERIGTKMSDELIDRLVGEMEKFRLPFWFSPFKVNEPLLDKRVLPLLERVNRRIPKCRIRLFSNGSTLTDANLDRIAGLKRLEHLWVSLNDYREAEYEKLMGLSWKRTTENLDRLHARDFPHTVMLSCVGFPNEDFRRYCFDRWPKFKSMAIKQDAWIDFIEAQEKVVPDKPCWRWFELNIMADGKVSLCCMDGEGKYQIGDINKQSLLEVYNSPHWRDRREKLVSRRSIDPCSRCTY